MPLARWLDKASPKNIVLRRFALGCLALILAELPAVAVPRLTCYTVQPGDTASDIAVRLTNDARSQYAAWFQIFDPATPALIPKRQYRHIQPGWRACVVEQDATEPRDAAYQPNARTADARPMTAGLAALIVAVGWWWVPLVISATALAGSLLQSYADQRRSTFLALERFGNAFVREFERPLIPQRSGESPLRSRLRVIPDRRRLDVLLAPGDGTRYPNLSDHRKNLEYDVNRVMSVLDDARFACGNLAAQGPWVVIPFRLETSSKKEGQA